MVTPEYYPGKGFPVKGEIVQMMPSRSTPNSDRTDLGHVDVRAFGTFVFHAIGIIETPYDDPEGMPIQPGKSTGARGRVRVFPDYAAGLKDLEGFSRIYLIYLFHRCSGWSHEVVPFLDDQPHGVFATRAPRRPNPIGLSTVRLLSVHDAILDIEGVDMLNGTPLLDIKPYISSVDSFEGERYGWFPENPDLGRARSDRRFL